MTMGMGMVALCSTALEIRLRDLVYPCAKEEVIVAYFTIGF